MKTYIIQTDVSSEFSAKIEVSANECYLMNDFTVYIDGIKLTFEEKPKISEATYVKRFCKTETTNYIEKWE